MIYKPKGIVYLVGAGPGNPELITLKGKELLSKADVIIYDSLINEELLSYAKEECEIIFVGKRKGHKVLDQDEINKLLVDRARKNKTVVRLKGGDPCIFGRGGEEAEELARNNVEFEIVPGVSSISSVPAYAGVSLTHRGFNSSFAVVTGHENPYSPQCDIDWDALSKMETIVFLMSLDNTKDIMNKLMEHGMSPKTPVLITSCGTTPFQKTITGMVSDIADKLDKMTTPFTTPAITVVGEVVSLRKSINWFEKKPLYGKKILLTRPKHQIKEMVQLLRNHGGQVIEFPTIEISPPSSWSEIDKSLKNMAEYDYVIFTSANGVNIYLNRALSLGIDSRIFGGLTIIAIGEKTDLALRKFGLRADIIPKSFVAESILEFFKGKELTDKKILLPRAAKARNLLPQELKKRGAVVKTIPCYNTIIPEHNQKTLNKVKTLLKKGEIDIVTFTSSSTVTNFFTLLDNLPIHKKTVFATIGPVTSNTLSSYGIRPHITAKTYTTEGLVSCIIHYFSKNIKN